MKTKYYNGIYAIWKVEGDQAWYRYKPRNFGFFMVPQGWLLWTSEEWKPYKSLSRISSRKVFAELL